MRTGHCLASRSLRSRNRHVLELIDCEIDRIRKAIADDGSFVGTPEDLAVLGREIWSETAFGALARLALQEQWAFTFLSDGRIELTALHRVMDAVS